MRVLVVVAIAAVAAAALPNRHSGAVPLEQVRLIRETSAPPSAVAAAARNGNRSGRKGSVQVSLGRYPHHAATGFPDLVTIALR